MCSFYVLLFILNIGAIKSDGVKEVFRRDGDVNVAVILGNECNTTTILTETEQFLVNSAIWTVHQLNFSEAVTFGLSVYKACDEKEQYQTIFDLFQKRNEEFLIGLISTSKLNAKIQRFCDALDLNVKYTVKHPLSLIKASVALLSTLNWVENVTVIAPNDYIVEQFSKISKKNWICIKEYLIYDPLTFSNSSSGCVVVFGGHNFLKSFLKKFEVSASILVALDGSLVNELPENSYLISSAHFFHNRDEEHNFYTPSPHLLEIATPLVSYAQGLKVFIADNCNETTYKPCLRNKFQRIPHIVVKTTQIIDLLKIETSSINYYVYKSDNVSLLYTKVFSYNIFNENLTHLDSVLDFDNTSRSCKSEELCKKECKNFEIQNQINLLKKDRRFRIRTESWVFAFLSLSLLGVLLCIAILIFLLVSICRQTVLEGNPLLTILLLLTVMLMYCSILPLSLEGNVSAKNSVCLGRAFAVTLSFSAAFSLILSRSILLATASKEIGFMSHVAGPVQSFLCLFIFGVQAALNLQVVNRCDEIFRGYSFIYLLSYNVMLLLLLLCLCPLIYKCQRNYKEGKYFTLTTTIISLFWCIWVPSYALLEEEYKDAVLCFGLVSTASIIMGTIFVPRTYLMTLAAARDKITSTLPSIAAASSAMDLYRAGSQPVYDCVNVAAINAVTVARAGLTPLQQPDLYSCPNLPEDDFDLRCDSPVPDDKVTRF